MDNELNIFYVEIMHAMQSALMGVFADVFTNISSGWFALLLIEPSFDPEIEPNRLTMRFVSGTITLSVAYFFRTVEKSYERL